MINDWSACLQTLEGHSNGVTSVAFSHNSTHLASASGDKTVKIWDVNSGACLQTLEGHSSTVTSIAFSHDSTWLASASYDKTVKILDASSGVCLQTLTGHRNGVTSIAFSHNSTQMASASEDMTVKIWDASSGACLQTLAGHWSDVKSVTFSRDSTRLASASGDKTVKIWNTSSGACLQTLNIGRPLHNLSFDPTDSCVDPETGTIIIPSLEVSSITDIAGCERPQYLGTSLSLDSTWISYAGNDMLRVPSEYRPSCSSVCGTTVGIGVSSGRVWICNVNLQHVRKCF